MKCRKIRKGFAFLSVWVLIFSLLIGSAGIVRAQEEEPTLSGANLETKKLSEAAVIENVQEEPSVSTRAAGRIRWLCKEVVSTASEVEGIEGIPEGITYPETQPAVFPRNKRMTLLFKITVKGTAGIAYTLKDSYSSWVSGGLTHGYEDDRLWVEGVLPESGEEFVYLTRTFSSTQINNGRLISSVVIVPGCNGAKNTTSVEVVYVKDSEVKNPGLEAEDLSFQIMALYEEAKTERVQLGTIYDYVVTVTNHLSVPINDLVIYEKPEEYYVKLLNVNPSRQYDEKTGLWSIGTLGAEETKVLRLTVRAARTTEQDRPYRNQIRASIGDVEVPMGADDITEAEIEIQAAENSYTVYYHYHDLSGEHEDGTETVTGTGEVGAWIPYDTDSREYQGETYHFVSVSEPGKVISEKTEENVLHVYYEREEPKEPDPEEPDPEEPDPEEPDPEEPDPEEPDPEEPDPEEPDPEEPDPEEPDPEEPDPEEPDPEEPDPEEPDPEKPDPEEPDPEEPDPEEPDPEEPDQPEAPEDPVPNTPDVPEEPDPEELVPDIPDLPEEPDPDTPDNSDSNAPDPTPPPKTPRRPDRPSHPDPDTPPIEIPSIPVPTPVILSPPVRLPPGIEAPNPLPTPSVPVKISKTEVRTESEEELPSPKKQTKEAEEKIPLARGGRHRCCILHFFIMLTAFMTEWLYTKNSKRHQKRIFELRRTLLQIEQRSQMETGEEIR